jgi:uncharacterized protein YndB with AHSA1/START domain
VIAFETNVRIDRPVEEVFAYVSEPLNFPRWNWAVESMRKTSAGQEGVGSRYVMERELPTGHAINELNVVASEPPREFAIRATTGPTPFLRKRRDHRAPRRRGRIARSGHPSATGCPARGQERCRPKPRDAEADSRSDSWETAPRLTATPFRITVRCVKSCGPSGSQDLALLAEREITIAIESVAVRRR